MIERAAVEEDGGILDTDEPGSRSAVLVVGMHRSGTSAVARTLNLLGCELPKTLIPARENDNELGFWESRPIVDLNLAIFRSAGVAWDDWTPFNEDWYASPPAARFRELALEVLADEVGSAELFVLKDPRFCRLLPFWLDVVQAFGAEPRVVCPIRNPLEVGASMAARDNIDPRHAQLFWLRHVLDAEVASRDVPRSFIRYDDLLEQWEAPVVRLGAQLGVSWPKRPSRAAKQVGTFLSPKARHQQSTDEALLGDTGVSSWIRDTYEILTRWARDDVRATDAAALDAIRGSFDAAVPAFAWPTYSALRQARLARTDLNRRQDELDESRQRTAELEEAASTSAQLLEEAVAARTEAEAALAELREEADSNATRSQDTVADLKDRRREVGALRAELRALGEEVERLRRGGLRVTPAKSEPRKPGPYLAETRRKPDGSLPKPEAIPQTFDKPQIETAPDDILCFIALRDEAPRIPYFLEYYRGMGVTHFFAVDNASTDGSTELLRSQPDVHVFETEESYAGSKAGLYWTTELADFYGADRWCLTLDVDEIVVFPGSEQLDFHDLAKYMERAGQRGLFTVLLDMYSDKPLQETVYTSGLPFTDVCNRYDVDTYLLKEPRNYPPLEILGGPRARAFWGGVAATDLAMRKTPFVRWGPDARYVYSTHSLYPVQLSDVVGATLHFKFFASFADLAPREAARDDRMMKEHYAQYAEQMARESVRFTDDFSRTYEDSISLMRDGVATASEWYLSYAAETIGDKLGAEAAADFSRRAGAALEEARGSGLLSLRQLANLWPLLVASWGNALAEES